MIAKQKIYILIMILFPALGFGQFAVQPYAGINLIPLEANDLDGRTFSASLALGLDGEWGISERFGFAAGLRYLETQHAYKTSRTSSILDDPTIQLLIGDTIGQFIESLPEPFNNLVNTDDVQTTNGVVRLQYVQIPLRFQFKASRLRLGFGPTLNILFGVEDRKQETRDIPLLDIINIEQAIQDFTGGAGIPFGFSIAGSGTGDVETSTNNSGFNTFDIGLALEASYEFENNVVLGFSYMQGFMDYRENPISGDSRNSSLMLSLGYRIPVASSSAGNKPYGADGID